MRKYLKFKPPDWRLKLGQGSWFSNIFLVLCIFNVITLIIQPYHKKLNLNEFSKVPPICINNIDQRGKKRPFMIPKGPWLQFFQGNIFRSSSCSLGMKRNGVKSPLEGGGHLYILGQGLNRFLTNFRENRYLKSYFFNKFNNKYHLEAI